MPLNHRASRRRRTHLTTAAAALLLALVLPAPAVSQPTEAPVPAAAPVTAQVEDSAASATSSETAASSASDASQAAAGDEAPVDEPAAEGGDSDYDAVAPLPLAVRWLGFLSLLAAIGTVAFNLLVVRRLGAAVPERWAR
jgi:hypothetical protein